MFPILRILCIAARILVGQSWDPFLVHFADTQLVFLLRNSTLRRSGGNGAVYTIRRDRTLQMMSFNL